MSQRPNVLIIQTDQQSTWTLGCYGATTITTPHIDRLAKEGVTCDNFFTNCAVCTPSRGCFLTGQYPHQHGAHTNNAPLHKTVTTFADVLKGEGYRTGYCGKWHLDGDASPGWMDERSVHGFEDSRYMFNRGHWKAIVERESYPPKVHAWENMIGDEESFTTDYLTNRTIEFIEEDSDQPFCYMVAIPDPHGPYKVRAPYDKLVDPESLEPPATFYEETLPDWAEEFRVMCDYPLDRPERLGIWREKCSQYWGEVKLIDDSVGRILSYLEKQGILDDTIVIFTSDHGDYMGEHALEEKNQLYEPAYRVPMIVRWPNGLPQDLRTDSIINIVDFMPTLLGWVSAEAPTTWEGLDRGATFLGEIQSEAEEASYIHYPDFSRVGIFTPEYELAFVKGSKDSILFDRQCDPDQVNNLFHDASLQEIIADLSQRILNHHQLLQSPALEWLEAHLAPHLAATSVVK